MKILFAINEATPLYKLGGLGDVAGSLPPALAALTIDIRLALPYHPEIKVSDAVTITEFEVVYNHLKHQIKVSLTHLPHSTVPVYLFHESVHVGISSGALDTYSDKYLLFSLAVARFVETYEAWQPDCVHCHDWHTALIPLLLKHGSLPVPPKTILTIHNLGYQGVTTIPVVDKLGLNEPLCRILSWDSQDGDVNLLMEGLLHADAITTVSPTYAKEILTKEYGHHLDTIMIQKKHILTGILNGLDTAFFNPATDMFLSATYTAANVEEGKTLNKQDLCRMFHLENPQVPLVSYIGRIDPYQKGIDIILEYLYRRSTLPPHHFFFLGTGDLNVETQLHNYAKNDASVRVITQFNEPLAHQIYAASDFLIIPSRYEPCGLIQMIAMRYGTIPLAHKTGGLADTINAENGFLYTPNTVDHLCQTIMAALNIYEDRATFSRLQQQALHTDFSWDKSAVAYSNVYHQVIYSEANL